MQTVSEMQVRLREKAFEDESFRARLIADPRSVISEEFGISIPEDFNIQVHEDSPTTAHFILPPSPRLTEEDLAQIAGAHYSALGHGNSGGP
ncbi:MAG: NHLP leader peptide family natural product precursor [Chloroflexi bacterium]|nr:NHLP leader peptide family natural product precursor [Chloroflexota bacterium]